MNYAFKWPSAIANNTCPDVEAKIDDDLCCVHSPIRACHAGTGVVTLGLSDSVIGHFVGNIRCACGKTLGEIRSSADACNVTISRITAGA